MREITMHKANPLNDLLTILVLDEPGAGGADHEYRVSRPGSVVTCIEFQNGPIAEVGVNGLTHEVLLAIVIDRLQSFQAGPFACRENANALRHVEEALKWLISRTKDRMRRGVEGTSVK